MSNLEVFYVCASECQQAGTVFGEMLDELIFGDGQIPDNVRRTIYANTLAKEELEGWYYWYCEPGCLPDGEPFGPFESEDAALADAAEYEARYS
jgi:hypothetical protein